MLRHCALYMDETRASTLVHKIFSLELQTDDIHRTVCVRARCVLKTEPIMLACMRSPWCSLLLTHFSCLQARTYTIARRHRRINAPFL